MALSKHLESCSLERIIKMKDVVMQEIASIDRQLAEEQKELDEMIEKVETVSLSKRHGHYELNLDKVESQIAKLNVQKEKLLDKAAILEEVRQKKHLMNEQARVLGSAKRVVVKDMIIFLLILFVIGILVVDLLGIGATGEGAVARAEVENGQIRRVVVLNEGTGYERVNVEIADEVGSGALVTGQVVAGKLTQVEVIEAGEHYVSPTVAIAPHFAVGKLWLFWIIDVVCCTIFMVNFFFEHALAASKKWYWKRNWIDFATSIPLPPVQVIAASGQLEFVRLGRLLRAMRILRALRVFRIALFFWRGMDHLSSTLDVRLLKRSLLYGLLSLVFGACIFMGLERMESGSGFWASLWWSFTTLVTGGYADIHNPQTASGKILTVFLVITGMVLVGVFTATLTSILVSDEDSLKVEELEEQVGIVTKVQEEVRDVNERLDKIEGTIGEIRDAIRSNQS